MNIWVNNLYIRFCTYCVAVFLFLRKVPVIHKICCIGFPQIVVSRNSMFRYGYGITMVNNALCSTLGRANRCKIVVYDNALLQLGNNIGMSNVTIVATKRIVIGNNVLIGAGVTIVDSDFHSMNFHDWFTFNDERMMKRASVSIGSNVFIGMNSIILKSVTIGDNVRMAAGSVVSKDIPSNEIWGGNPARLIRKITAN